MTPEQRIEQNGIEQLRDFIDWLFDISEHLDHITYSEAFEEFEKWSLQQETNP